MKLIVSGLILLASLLAPAVVADSLPELVPLPQAMTAQPGTFHLTPETKIFANYASLPTARQLAEKLRRATGYPFKVGLKLWEDQAVPNAIFLTTKSADPALGAEGYSLEVAANSVVLRAPAQAGLFYGTQTLRQLLPPQIYATNTVAGVDWQIPCVRIEDQPRFPWRGFMLDVARHFYTKHEVERVLDLMAEQKLNTFHWHLVDDQGWRIEIKKYPLLTKVGAWRDGVGFGLDPHSTKAYGRDGRYGGFYTQKDIRQVVAYAEALHITIVPEIEMPGHSSAALTAYPQYACPGVTQAINAKGGIFNGVYCAGNDDTFVFLQNVLSEVMDLFPGQYIHIGGDEVPKDNWKKCDKCQARIKAEGLQNEEELQSYFIRRIEKMVDAHGHNLIGWSEIREGGLAPSAAVMDWIGGAVEAASAGHHVVMSPTDYCYLDYYQSTNHDTEPRAIGGYLPLSKVYALEAVPPTLPAGSQNLILGGQANLWTEYIASFSHVQYMMFPRVCAVSEALWSPKAARDWTGFQQRFPAEMARLEAEGVNYRKGDSE